MAHIFVLKRGHFFGIDNDIIDVYGKIIGANGVAVYAALRRFTKGKTQECWPSIGTLCKVLALARNTVKDTLRKLEAVGLILIDRLRRDAAGDPTSHLYTCLDTTPQATEARQRQMAAELATKEGRSPADLPLSANDLPGRSLADPEPKVSPEHKEMNQVDAACAEEETPAKQRQITCSHPEDSLRRMKDGCYCAHCWKWLDDTEGDTTQTSATEEAPAHAAYLVGVAD